MKPSITPGPTAKPFASVASAANPASAANVSSAALATLGHASTSGDKAQPRLQAVSSHLDPTIKPIIFPDFSKLFQQQSTPPKSRQSPPSFVPQQGDSGYLKAFLQAGNETAKAEVKTTPKEITTSAVDTIAHMTREELANMIQAGVAAALKTHLAPESASVLNEKATPLSYDQAKPEPVKEAPILERHSAICDGCDQDITGVRHKCLDCSDFDFCQSCFIGKSDAHKEHRFVRLLSADDITPAKAPPAILHLGVHCDGALCQREQAKSGERCIRGVRFTCLECEDFDLCARCQTHPEEKHCPQHTLLRITAPVGQTELRRKLAKAAGAEAKSSNLNTAIVHANRTIAAIHDSIQAQLQATAKTLHGNVSCDVCHASPMGDRFACLECDDYDLCGSCFYAGSHDASHVYTQHKVKVAPGQARPITKAAIIDDLGVGPCACDACGGVITTACRRWHCATCPDYDLCEKCVKEDKHGHDVAHPMHVLPGQPQTTARHLRAASPEIDFVERAQKREVAPKTEGRSALSAKLIEARGVADGSIVVTKGLINKSWLVENDGHDAWPVGTRIVPIGGVRLTQTVDPANMAEAVQPGGRCVVSTVITAPGQAQNNVISYWQLQTPLGVSLGPKLWLDIDVKDMEEGSKASDPAETRPSSGTLSGVSSKSAASSELILPSASTELVKDGSASSIRTASQGPASSITGARSSNDDGDDGDDDGESIVTVELSSKALTADTNLDGVFTDDEYDLLENESLSDHE